MAYRIFISHSWTYSDAYEKLVNILNNSNLEYSNYSVPKDDPIHNTGTDKELYNAIKNKISPCNIVLIMAGVYSTYSKWIDKEVKICKRDFNKPLVGIIPWENAKVSSLVRDNADTLVHWRSDSIINAIKKYSI